MKQYVWVFFALALVGCASKPLPEPISERVILLPSASGKPTAVVVTTRHGEVELSTAYAVAEVRRNATQFSSTTAEEVSARYGALLAAQPKEPRAFTVFFMLGTEEFTAESKLAFELARGEVAAWEGADLVVIGHTDRIGRDDANDLLSRKRAQMVATRLISSGVSADRIKVVGRGEREPLIVTEDEVDEPRNRRVVIKVR